MTRQVDGMEGQKFTPKFCIAVSARLLHRESCALAKKARNKKDYVPLSEETFKEELRGRKFEENQGWKPTLGLCTLCKPMWD